MKSITFHKKVETIGKNAFIKITNLYNTSYLGKRSPTYKNSIFSNSKIEFISVSQNYQDDHFCLYPISKSLIVQFTPSLPFTISMEFTPSHVFSQSNEFTDSEIFSSSQTFTSSNSFSKSTEFTSINVFTQFSKITTSHYFKSNKIDLSTFLTSYEFESYTAINEKSNNSKKSYIIIAVPIVLVILIAVNIILIIFFFNSKKEKQNEFGWLIWIMKMIKLN